MSNLNNNINQVSNSVLIGLDYYEIIKTSIGLIIFIYLFCCVSCSFLNIYNNNYQHVQGTIILNSSNNTQLLTYKINNTIFTKIIPFSTKKYSITASQPMYSNGPHTVYYPKNNPDNYNIDTSPFTFFFIKPPIYILKLVIFILCFCIILISISLILLITNNTGGIKR